MNPFAKILCAVDDGPRSVEAARQAIVLAGEGAELRFVTVCQTVRQRFSSSPEPEEEGFRAALEESVRLAEEAGVSASSEIFNALYAADVLLPESRNYDLLVIGGPDHSRAAGIALAGTSSRLVHDAEGAVLVARPAAGEAAFPKRVLLADGRSEGSGEAAARAASWVADAFDARLESVSVDGNVVQEIVEAAEQAGSSLIVTGHRGLRGLRALSSVSEQVVHTAPCSVLLVPDEAGDEPAAA